MAICKRREITMTEEHIKTMRYEKVTLICATETYRDINDPANPMEAMNFIETGASDCTILEYHSEPLHFETTNTLDTKPVT